MVRQAHRRLERTRRIRSQSRKPLAPHSKTGYTFSVSLRLRRCDMHLSFSNHAKAGMYERSIGASRIADTIRRPDFVRPAGDDATAYYRAFGKQTLRVVAASRKKSECVIVTVYY